MNLYKYFLISYCSSSLVCFVTEMMWPSIRVKPISQKQIIENYKIMIPSVGLNLILAYPYLLCFEKYLTYNDSIMNHSLKNYSYSVDSFYLFDLLLWHMYLIYYFICWVLLSDIFFYGVHYLLHTPQMYWLHAKHHSFRYTHGIGAIYSSVFEFIVGNLGTTSLPIYILSIPQDYVKIFIIFASSYTVFISHSGFTIVSNTHLIHHLKYKVNYGLVCSDKYFGTKHLPLEPSSKQFQK